MWAWTLRLLKLPRSCFAKRSWRPGDFFSPGMFLSGASAGFAPGRPGFRLLAMVPPIENSENHRHGGPPSPAPSTPACARQSPMALFARFPMRRRSSGVERALGKGEAEGSIPSGGTIKINGLGNNHAAVIGGVFVLGAHRGHSPRLVAALGNRHSGSALPRRPSAVSWGVAWPEAGRVPLVHPGHGLLGSRWHTPTGGFLI